jgi:hypothetical protein
MELVLSSSWSGLTKGICMPKPTIWIYLGVPWNGNCRHILYHFAIFMAIREIFCSFGIFSRFGMPYEEKSGHPAICHDNIKLLCSTVTLPLGGVNSWR